jgi:transcriptional regulator with XRE-family HTH domain
MENKLKNIGERIKAVRKNLPGDLNQAEFGNLFGASKSTVSEYEKGARLPDPVILAEIAALGETTTDYLIKGQEPRATTREYLGGLMERDRGSLVNEENSEYNSGPLKLTRQEEEVVYWLRGMPPDLRDIAAEGVRSVWIMANRRSETQKHSE